MDAEIAAKISALENIFGKENFSGFGSNVVVEEVAASANLDDIAVAHYKTFIGKNWTADSESSWKEGFKKVWNHQGSISDLFGSLNGIKDSQAKISLPLFTELGADPERQRAALMGFFQTEAMEIMALYIIGDGAAMSGVLLSGRLSGGIVCSVMAMMD